MDALQALFSRRSIRAFTSHDVPEDAVRIMLRAAMSAPSAGDQQPWRFMVLRNRATLAQLAKDRPYASMLLAAPMAILLCAEVDRLQHPDYWEQDLAAATENLLLAAHAQGLGAVWVGLHPRTARVDVVRSLVPIPANQIPFAIVPVGYPAERPEQPDRVRPEWITELSS